MNEQQIEALRQAVAGLSREQVVEQVALSVHNFAEPEAVADYLLGLVQAA